jgi:hypothetical protein
MQKSKFKIKFFLLIAFSLTFPLLVSAAILYLEPSSGMYHQGDTFIVKMRIDTEGECINTVKANLSFSQNVLKAVEFSTGNSILTLWLQSPEINQNEGKISFVGGVPGGFCGALPGEPGKPNLLGKIVFKVKETSEKKEAVLRFSKESQVLLNDGFGTPAKLDFRNANFEILPEKSKIQLKEWKKELEKDNVPPEPFEIKLIKDPMIFEGKWFIVFFTVDKQSGIDHYEVKEGEREWRKAKSPYLLEDQDLKSIIKVKAVDKAGNERIVEWVPQKEILSWWKIVIILIILITILVIWKLKKKIRTPKENKT